MLESTVFYSDNTMEVRTQGICALLSLSLFAHECSGWKRRDGDFNVGRHAIFS